MRQRWKYATLLLLVGACADDPTAPAPPNAPVPSPSPPSTGRDIPLYPLFEVSLDVGGTFEPGGEIEVAARVASLKGNQLANLRITLPEVEAARQTGWAGMNLSPANTYAPAHQSVTMIPAASPERVGTSLSIPVRGIYRVVATAEVIGETPDSIQGAVFEEGWLLIDSGAARGFYATLEAAAAAAGASGGPTELGPEVGSPQMVLDPHYPAEAPVNLVYFHPYQNRYIPIPDSPVRIEYWDDDMSTCPDCQHVRFATESYTTDSDGAFPIKCTYAEWYTEKPIFTAVAGLQNDRANIGGSIRKTDLVSQPCYYAYMERPYYIVVESYIGHALVTMTEIGNQAASWFGVGRSAAVTVFLSGTIDNSFYDPDDDDIWLQSIAVFQSTARTMAHEYGHAYHNWELGGLAPNTCPEHHYLSGAHTLECAFNEGFADYLAVALRGPTAYAGVASNAWPPASPTTSTDSRLDLGLIIEGAVAGFLYDLTDPVGDETFDLVQVPARALRTVMRECDVIYSNYLVVAIRAIDHLIYCIEGNVQAHSLGYFEDILRPSGVRATPIAGLDPGAFRALWLATLTEAGTSGGDDGGDDPVPPPPPPPTCVEGPSGATCKPQPTAAS